MSPKIKGVFSMFSAMFGSQKMSAVYENMNPDAVARLWDQQLSGFDDKTVRKAVQAVMDSDSAWPPSLPQFKAICRDFHRPESQTPALEAPMSQPNPEVMEKIAGIKPVEDHLRWARNPKSMQAMMAVIRGCQGNRAMRTILEGLVSNPSKVTDPEVRKFLNNYTERHEYSRESN